MKKIWKTGIMFGIMVLFMLSSCYEKIDVFDILSGKEHVIQQGKDTTIYIKTNGYNRIGGVYIDTDSIFFMYPKEKYPITNQNDSLFVAYFTLKPMHDTAPVKSVNTSFFHITNLSDNQEDERPVYKVEIKNKHIAGKHKITLLLFSRMAGNEIIFNLK